MNTLYLNNSGSRWRNVDRNGRNERIMVDIGAGIEERAIIFWEQCGNFAFPRIKVKGKRVCLYKSFDGAYWTTFELKYPNSAVAIALNKSVIK